MRGAEVSLQARGPGRRRRVPKMRPPPTGQEPRGPRHVKGIVRRWEGPPHPREGKGWSTGGVGAEAT